jgi:cytochrome oxidase Cu insertion factor (SCO1/SenC/PrrC family)
VSTTATTVADATPTDTEAPPATAPPVDGPPAPDFTLTLDDGSEFTLSAEHKPVYLVFWAEW